MIKIVFTDADGTLLNTAKKVSERNINICSKIQKQNIPIVVTTGRYGASALEIAKRIDNFIMLFNQNFSDLEIVKNTENIYSISKKNVNKGTAVKWLCDKLNINPKNALGIGDNYNDISMFEIVGYPIVMGNADDTVKSFSTLIVPSNDEDGFYHGVSSLITN